jgi:hypothetical protein
VWSNSPGPYAEFEFQAFGGASEAAEEELSTSRSLDEPNTFKPISPGLASDMSSLHQGYGDMDASNSFAPWMDPPVDGDFTCPGPNGEQMSLTSKPDFVDDGFLFAAEQPEVDVATSYRDGWATGGSCDCVPGMTAILNQLNASLQTVEGRLRALEYRIGRGCACKDRERKTEGC